MTVCQHQININHLTFNVKIKVSLCQIVCVCVFSLSLFARLVEETYTADEVSDMLEGLQAVVRGEVEMELINTAHTNVLLLRQLFSQAEKYYLKLQTDVSELENRCD